MALRVANMVEAQLPATPEVATFVQGMLAIVLSDPTPPPQVVRSDMFDGALHAVVETIPKGSKKVQEAILKLFGQFDHCRLYKGVNVGALDEWFTLLAKYSLDPKCMTDEVEQQEQIMVQRKQLCTSQKVDTYSLNPDSLRTYVNTAGKVWNQTGTQNKIYLSSNTQFPKFNRFLNNCITRHRAAKAIKKAGSNQAETEILQDHELEKLEKMNSKRQISKDGALAREKVHNELQA